MEKQALIAKAVHGEALQDDEYAAIFTDPDLTVPELGIVLSSMAMLAYHAAGFEPRKIVIAATVLAPRPGRQEIVEVEFRREGDIGVVDGCIYRHLRGA